jgi:cysteine-rich repeat protein
VVIDVLGNDFDDNGAIDPSTVIEVSAPSNGTTSVDVVSGEITYFHNGSPGTNDSFGYTVEDSEGLVSNPGSVFITIFDAPGVTLDTPADGANVVGDTLNLTYTITGEASLWNHIHFQLDSDPHISDFTPDGTFSFLNVPVGPHTITTWLVMSDHQALPYPESLDSIGVTMIAGEACGNGVVEGSEECDDDNLVDGDCCSSTCTNEPAASACSDGDACTLADSCDGAGLCLSGAPLVCDDTFYCNGLETCDSIVGCEAGTPPVVSDGVACTNDSCDEALDIVVNTPNDALCDDSLYCNGAETCDDQLGCQAGAPPIVDDGVACTDDGCDEVGDVVVNLPNDAGCNDGLFCNGGEICDAVTGCGTGSPPVVDDGVACTADTCDETDDVIVNDPVDLACDDGDVCTADSCDAVSGCANDVIPGCEVAVPAGSPWSHGGLILLLMAVSSLSLGVLRRQSA